MLNMRLQQIGQWLKFSCKNYCRFKYASTSQPRLDIILPFRLYFIIRTSQIALKLEETSEMVTPITVSVCCRMQYRKDAQLAYQQRMLAAQAGKGEYPRIRTFLKSDFSTNSVFRDLEAAESLYVLFCFKPH